MILAGDVGGTNTRLAGFEVAGGALVPRVTKTYPSHAHPSLEAIVEAFVRELPGPVAHACFGVAGPVLDDRVQAVNIPWSVEGRSLAARLGLSRLVLINDLEANAWGLAALGPGDVAVLQAGRPVATGNAAVVAAGTGLGEAGLVWDGRRHRPFPTEAGHADWAPQDERQIALWRFLAAEFGHVSVERVLSGPGLHNIYRFLRDVEGLPEPPGLGAALAAGDPAPVIAGAGLEGRAEICRQALEIFAAIYGAEAGNLGLRVLATAGVYLGGGIAPRILPALRGPAFRAALLAKGRLRSVVEAIPVLVILNDQTALLGAARRAALDAGLLA